MARAGLAPLEVLEDHISEVGKHYEELKVWAGSIWSLPLNSFRLQGGDLLFQGFIFSTMKLMFQVHAQLSIPIFELSADRNGLVVGI